MAPLHSCNLRVTHITVTCYSQSDHNCQSNAGWGICSVLQHGSSCLCRQPYFRYAKHSENIYNIKRYFMDVSLLEMMNCCEYGNKHTRYLKARNFVSSWRTKGFQRKTQDSVIRAIRRNVVYSQIIYLKPNSEHVFSALRF
jgi:hypothetical protein